MFFVIVCGCYREPDTSSADTPMGEGGNDSGSGCVVGREGCACGVEAGCEAGLVCADARCVRPDSDDGTSGAATSTSTTTSTSTSIGTSTSESSSGAPESSESAGSTGAICDGTCIECYGCAVAGPCSDELAACTDNACANTPFCLLACTEQQYSCAECCVEATLTLAVELVECFAEACGLDCSFRC